MEVKELIKLYEKHLIEREASLFKHTNHMDSDDVISMKNEISKVKKMIKDLKIK